MGESLSLEYLNEEGTVLRSALDSIFDGVYIVDPQRRILFWNRGAEKITGYSAAEVAGRCCADNILNHIDENGRLLCKGHCPLAKTLKTGEEIRAKVYPLHQSGKRFPVLTHMAPLRDSRGAIIAAIEVFRDISTEEEFRILQEKFNKIVRTYISETTFDEILSKARSGVASEVQTRDLTILYLDVVGFTALSEKSTPRQVVEVLNDVFGICDVITREKHGDIDKFIGDAIMAVFIDAQDAVEASEKILHEALPHFNQLRAEEQLEPIRIRIGVNSGIVLQGDVGTTDRKDLTVIGDVVNTAQRIESICEPNALFISESTFSRLRNDLIERFGYFGEVKVKGREELVRVFALRRL